MIAPSVPPLPDTSHPIQRWPATNTSARALALAAAAARDSRPWVVVVPDARSLEQLQRALQFFAAGQVPVLQLPDPEVLPYEQFSPLPDLVSERLATLARLPQLHRGLLLISAETLLQRLPPTDYIDARAFDLTAGQTFSMRRVSEQLARAGYQLVGQVSAPGEFALRGSLFDVFPMGYAQPLRIDLFDEVIDSIRHFDPDTQRSLDKLQRLRLLPAREVPLDEESCKEFRRRYRQRFEGDPTRSAVYRGLRQNTAPAGIEFYLPLFFERTATLFDYLPSEPVFVTDAALPARLAQLWQQIAARHEDLRHDIEHPVLEPRELFQSPEEMLQHIADRPQVIWTDQPDSPVVLAEAAPPMTLDARDPAPLAPLVRYLQNYAGRVLLAADSPGRREVLQDLLRAADLPHRQVGGWAEFLAADAKLCLTIAPDVAGLSLQQPAVTLLADGELFGRHAQQERRRRRTQLDPAAILRDLQDLAAGAPVVHAEYGVGRYVGLQPMQVAGEDGEFLIIEYAGGDRIYVPVASLQLVSRYTGAAADAAPLHKLGTDQWAKAKRRASEQVRDVAAELLDLYARRQARKGSALIADDADYRAFAAAFPFEETADQREAIASVLRDMASDRPMDRVVCGDVGFGKTEVAMRAAFVAVQAGHQVAVLVRRRCWPNSMQRISATALRTWRCASNRCHASAPPRASKDILAQLTDGKIDILVATHRLLHADARFKNLGLIIVDEEHRFGVRDKERLKALRAEVHVLTLTATPIPRTLNMALGGLRELSLITTPPAGRVAIRTTVGEWHAPAIREAVLRELRRGGQIYFVHNEIQSIDKIAEDLRRIVPEASIRVGPWPDA